MQKYGGISRYFAELLNIFQSNPDIQFDLTTRFPQNAYAQQYHLADRTPVQRLQNRFFEYFAGIEAVSNLRNNINAAYRGKLLHAGLYDIFHPTYYDPDFIELIGDKPVVLTVYDMIHEMFPEMYSSDDPSALKKRKAIARADKIIAISEHTKRDIVRLAGIADEKIAVVHLAGSLKPGGKASINLPGKFILFVGERIRYKNFERFLRAIASLLHKDPELYVICASGWQMTEWEKSLLAELDLERQVVQYAVDDATLACLYGKALMFVFPSLYEGFGMPILEAFSCGCPVIASNTSSFPEVAADAALYIDPLDIESIRDAVESVMNKKELRVKLINAGLKRVTCFSWEKTAQETKTVYESLL